MKHLNHEEWYDKYKNLELLDGELEFFMDDDQDMLTITYSDGMEIDVGYIDELKTYYITTTDKNHDWNNPLEVKEILQKQKLFDAIQETVFKYRKILKVIT